MDKKRLKHYLPVLTDSSIYLPPPDLQATLSAFVKDPAQAWGGVFASRQGFKQLFERYVFFLAAVPSLSRFFGQVLFAGAPFLTSLLYCIISYLLSVAFLYAATFLAHRSAEIFDGTLSLDAAAKLIVYSFIPFFLSGVFFLLPPLSILAISGLYALYLFYTGVKAVAGIPEKKRMLFFMINVVSWIVSVSLLLDLL